MLNEKGLVDGGAPYVLNVTELSRLEEKFTRQHRTGEQMRNETNLRV